MAKLIPCSHCQRHVRLDSGECPFCGATLTVASPEARTGKLPMRLLLTAAALSLGVACGEDDGSSVVALYGAPIDDDSSVSSSASSGAGGDGSGGDQMTVSVGAGGNAAGGDMGSGGSDQMTASVGAGGN